MPQKATDTSWMGWAIVGLGAMLCLPITLLSGALHMPSDPTAFAVRVAMLGLEILSVSLAAGVLMTLVPVLISTRMGARSVGSHNTPALGSTLPFGLLVWAAFIALLMGTVVFSIPGYLQTMLTQGADRTLHDLWLITRGSAICTAPLAIGATLLRLRRKQRKLSTTQRPLLEGSGTVGG